MAHSMGRTDGHIISKRENLSGRLLTVPVYRDSGFHSVLAARSVNRIAAGRDWTRRDAFVA